MASSASAKGTGIHGLVSDPSRLPSALPTSGTKKSGISAAAIHTRRLSPQRLTSSGSHAPSTPSETSAATSSAFQVRSSALFQLPIVAWQNAHTNAVSSSTTQTPAALAAKQPMAAKKSSVSRASSASGASLWPVVKSESRQPSHAPRAMPTKPARAPARPNHARPAKTTASSTAASASSVRGSSSGNTSCGVQLHHRQPHSASGAAAKAIQACRPEDEMRTSESASAARSSTKGHGPVALERAHATNVSSVSVQTATNQASSSPRAADSTRRLLRHSSPTAKTHSSTNAHSANSQTRSGSSSRFRIQISVIAAEPAAAPAGTSAAPCARASQILAPESSAPKSASGQRL